MFGIFADSAKRIYQIDSKWNSRRTSTGNEPILFECQHQIVAQILRINNNFIFVDCIYVIDLKPFQFINKKT